METRSQREAAAAWDEAVGWQAVLSHFPRAQPSLVADRDMQDRTESKFVMPEDAALAMVMDLQRDVAILPARDALVARYESLYFDTAGLALFHAHRRGRRIRYKVRIRHYPDRHLSTLEVKIRQGGGRTIKLRRAREQGDNVLTASDENEVRTVCALTDALLPKAWVTYRRITLLGLRSRERVTIDTALDLWSGTQIRRLRGLAVIEVKQPRLDRRSPAISRLRLVGARPRSISKYCTAIMTTSPDVQANALLGSLRRVQAIGTWT